MDVAFWSENSADGDVLRLIEAAANSFGGSAEDEPEDEKKKGRMGARERTGLIGSRAIALSSIPILINTV